MKDPQARRFLLLITLVDVASVPSPLFVGSLFPLQ